MSNGGCHAFFATFRPKKGITDATVGRIYEYLPKFCKYWFIVLEKDGEERHAHVTLFPKKPQQRSNLITMLTRACISDWDSAEKANFRRWDKSTKTGAVKTCTHLEVITDYLDGTRASKSEDKYEIISSNLPDDLSELESWMPQVGELERTKNIKFHTLLRQLVANYVMPERGNLQVPYLVSCIKDLENRDIRECICDPRIANNFAKKFIQWYNRDTWGDMPHVGGWCLQPTHLASNPDDQLPLVVDHSPGNGYP